MSRTNGDAPRPICESDMAARLPSELRKIRPLDPLERAHLDDAMAWAESGEPICRVAKPATPLKHLVAYFPVIDNDHILLVDHRNAGLWLPTGGHVEQGEHARDTVVRELQEELSLSIRPEDIGPPAMVTVTTTVGLTAGHVDVTLWYAIRGDRHAPVYFDAEEFHDARWFEFSALPLGRCEAHLRRFIRKLKADA